MPELIFFTGPMDCGKSTLALQVHHTHTAGGRAGRLFTSHDRSGQARVTSRLGLEQRALEVHPGFDFWRWLVDELTSGRRVDYLVCDEAQFYTAEQVDQLARIVDELQLDVFAFGILSDFRTRMFPASQRLVELCDRMETLQVRPLCWCGQVATHNARLVDGVMVLEGSQVAVGDTRAEQAMATGDQTSPDGSTPGEPEVTYEVLCRAHHRRRVTSAVARATLSPEPLPFEEV
ncbi:thymidine kinase [Desertihabitans brevis]|uniref:Thymidine kinase n=1 Tax=Desertihabitans brevis TaxID=2268447 RepID=A0A367Z0E2_9ACTN|nr:thymidine kinase [Desertihabitans brevis]RCK71357.1 thymidine kinase [Desertihabitans brevis]